VAHTFAERHIAIKKLMNEMKKPPEPWTVDSHQKNPETGMWHDCVVPIRLGEGVTRNEILRNEEITTRDLDEVLALVPNLRPTTNKRSTKLRADIGRIREDADNYTKYALNVGLPTNWYGSVGRIRPLGAKLLVRFLVHVGPEFYIDGDIDLRELRKYASSADIVEQPPVPVVEEQPTINDNKIVPEPETDGVERYARVKQRTGQHSLRQHMLSRNPTCPFTGVENPRMLKTSHIKPNRHCGFYERDGRVLHEKDDGANVLMLTPNADWLFDQGYVSFTEEGKLMRSTEITGADYRAMGLSHDASIEHLLDGPVGERRQGYMEHHRRFIFRGPNKEEWRG
tara:strand:+ start:913 stop:1932 length:1020 start_codon:yes stop_codon:yes gene_type:complete